MNEQQNNNIPANDEYSNISEQDERHPILTENERYYFEKQFFLSVLRGKTPSQRIQPPSLQELSTLSYGVRKIFEQNTLNNNNNNYFNNLNSDPINSGSMARILSFFSKYLDHRSPIDCARIWKFVQGKKEIVTNSADFQSKSIPETLLSIKYRKNSCVCVNKRKIAVHRKKEILLGSLDSKNQQTLNIADISLVVPYIDTFAAMTIDGNIYILKENEGQQPDYELFLNAQKPLSDFRISQTITPYAAALTNESQNIIFGQQTSFKEYKFADKITQFQISSSKLCFSTKSSFYVLDNDRIAASYEYSKSMNDFRILRNEMTVLAFGGQVYELFDLRTPDKIFISPFKTEDNILDCQFSSLSNLFSFSQQNCCSIFDLRNPRAEIMSFNATQNKDLSYKAKWIGDDCLIATANDDGICNLIDILCNSTQALRSYSLYPGKILDLNTTDDTIIITQPNTLSIIQMSQRPLFLQNFM